MPVVGVVVAGFIMNESLLGNFNGEEAAILAVGEGVLRRCCCKFSLNCSSGEALRTDGLTDTGPIDGIANEDLLWGEALNAKSLLVVELALVADGSSGAVELGEHWPSRRKCRVNASERENSAEQRLHLKGRSPV